MAETALLVGSLPLDVLVDIDGTGDAAIEGDFYLRSATAALSLLTEFVGLMTTAGLGDPSFFMRDDLLLELDNGAAGNFTVDWTSTQLRDLFGYTGNLSGDSNYVATNPSPLIWAPGYLATPTTIQGMAGYDVPHVTWHSNDDETRVQVQRFGGGVWQELDWALVSTSRLLVADGSNTGNTFLGFFQNVLQYGRRFIYHQSVTEGTSGNAIDWNDSEAFGPYQLRSPIDPSWYKRLVQNADDYGAGIGLEVKVVEDYS